MRQLLGSFARRINARYRKMSIHMVISLVFTAVALAGVLFLGLSLFWRFGGNTRALMQDNSRRILAQLNLNLDSYLRRMMRVSDTLYYSVIKNVDMARETPDEQMSLLYEENRDALVSIALFDSQGGLAAAVPLNELAHEAQPETHDWFTLALDKMENLHFSTPHVQNLFRDPQQQHPWVVSLSRQVQLTRGGVTESGVLLVDMNFSGIEQICRDVELFGGGYVYLVDSSGELIYHPRQQLIYAGLMEEYNQQAAGYGDGCHTVSFGGRQYQMTIKTVGYTGWKLVGMVPMEGMNMGINQLGLFGLSLLLFSAFLLAFLTFRISAHITDPIRQLEDSIKKLEEGQENVEIAEGGCYEIQHLGHTINSLVSTMRHLMDDIIQQEQQKRRSELDVLQSQINPHFLYNTLDSVIWMTEAGRYEESIQMVTSLARLFRISLSKGHSVIPLRDELEHARHYMTIQQIRFKNRFTAHITADETVEGLYTLKLIVQPLLENAIYHGMSEAEDDGEITVHAYRSGDEVWIDVQDNGLGMRPEVAAGLLDGRRHEPSGKGSGIGVVNVHQRIQLTFGRQYGLTIQSEPDEGTLVRIRIPVLDETAVIPYQKEGTA